MLNKPSPVWAMTQGLGGLDGQPLKRKAAPAEMSEAKMTFRVLTGRVSISEGELGNEPEGPRGLVGSGAAEVAIQHAGRHRPGGDVDLAGLALEGVGFQLLWGGVDFSRRRCVGRVHPGLVD